MPDPDTVLIENQLAESHCIFLISISIQAEAYRRSKIDELDTLFLCNTPILLLASTQVISITAAGRQSGEDPSREKAGRKKFAKGHLRLHHL